jgi:surfactin synthase thioesterase subunit
MTARPDGWLWQAPDASSRPIIVVHFPHAGGSSVSYRSWIRLYPVDLGFLSVELPGRGLRSGEPAAESIDAAADVIARELAPWSGHLIILFGHSMGALLAFEVARRAPHHGWEAARLVVSGSRAPSEDLGRPRIAHLDDAVFGGRAVELGLAPAAIVADAELAELFLKPLRADLALCEGYPWGRTEPIPVPLSVINGRGDHLVPLSSASSWRQLSTRPGTSTILNGGHMFVADAPRDVVEVVCAVARGLDRCR